jgi:hypothetical protein
MPHLSYSSLCNQSNNTTPLVNITKIRFISCNFPVNLLICPNIRSPLSIYFRNTEPLFPPKKEKNQSYISTKLRVQSVFLFSFNLGKVK